VAVVKPQNRATIGDMLRRGGGGSAAPSPSAPGAAALYTNGGGGYGLAAPAPAPAQQQAAAAAVPVAAASGRVNTGSGFASSAAAAAEAAPAASPVQYNPDGSVVLSSKPIKLVKPAHLLAKTYGYEDLEPQEAAGEEAAYAAAGAREQQGADVFDGYRRRDY
jgi:hypothetical protein